MHIYIYIYIYYIPTCTAKTWVIFPTSIGISDKTVFYCILVTFLIFYSYLYSSSTEDNEELLKLIKNVTKNEGKTCSTCINNSIYL